MKELVIVSGKGGTGKTTIAAAMAALMKPAVIVDADVDAPDLHILFQPEIQHRERFFSGWTARIKPGHCTACGKCEELCRFDAISFTGPGNGKCERTFAIDKFACEGCGVCFEFCRDDAILIEPGDRGEWFRSETRFGSFVHARLDPGAANSGRLVSLVRKEARAIAEQKNLDLIITDGAPGVGCPVIASLTGASLVLLVTEPTPSGWHDVSRVLELTKHFRIESTLVINKWDLYPDQSAEIEQNAAAMNCPTIGRIAFDTSIVTALMDLKTIPEALQGKTLDEITAIRNKLAHLLSI